jgi:hypothetical protein
VEGWGLEIRDWRLGIGYWAARRGRGSKVPGGFSFGDEGESSTIYYSTKVRVSDRVAEILMLVGPDGESRGRDLGG